MQPEESSSSKSNNLKSARKSSSSSNPLPRPAAQAPIVPSNPAAKSPQQDLERRAKRPRKWTIDLRKAARRTRQKVAKKHLKDQRTPETSQGASRGRPTGFQMHELSRAKNAPRNSSSSTDKKPSNTHHHHQVLLKTAQQNLKPAARQSKQGTSQTSLAPRAKPANSTNKQPTVATSEAKKAPLQVKSTERQRKGSISNLTRLARDGRKPPDHYRDVVRRASSPSGINIKSLTEFYDAPNQEFNTIDDVYAYRGYKKIAKLDEGAFGIVYKATRVGDNQPVALKEVDLSRRRSKRIEEMKRELFVLQKVDSPYMVKLVEHFIVANTLVIIMELCAGNNLTHYLKEAAVQEDEARHLFRQMATGIKIMHRAGIAHRDVKLNNFLLDSSRKSVKVADFGLSVVSYKQEQGVLLAKTYCGTEPYMAPEILRRNSRGFRQYNPMYADIWALGVCLYAMLTRTFPFKMNLSQKSLYVTQTARRWRIPRTLRNNISEDLKDLLWHMLDPESDRRITIIGVMSHPWLNPDAVTLSRVE